jgi:hypothetical protein
VAHGNRKERYSIGMERYGKNFIRIELLSTTRGAGRVGVGF